MVFNAATVNGAQNSTSLYLGARYSEVLDFLCSPVTGLANVKVLISEPGLGKTVMLRSAIERIKGEARTAFVFWTLFKAKDFISHLLFEMGSNGPPPTDLGAAQRQFETLLRRTAGEGKRFVLAIDEAHNLSPASLKLLSALLDRDTASPPQMTVLLAGLPTLHHLLADPEATGIRERIIGVKTVAPLNAEQTAEYITARMAALGAGPIAQEKLAQIAAGSGGVLRTIDKLCQQSLLQNGSRERRGNDAPHVDTPAKESAITREAQVSRIADWVTRRLGTWAGTVAELAAATGISADEILDVVENRSQELRRVGIAAAVKRAPGRPRMITLSRVEREVTSESHVSVPELHEDCASPPRQEMRQEPAKDPAPDHQPAGQGWLYPPIERPSAAKRWLAWGLRAAVMLAVMLGLAAALRYFEFRNSTHPTSSVSQPVSEPKRLPESDPIPGSRGQTQAGDIGSQAEPANRHRERDSVPRDEMAAMHSYEQAATRGDPVAQHRLGLALSSGKGGVAADPVAAYVWLVMARIGGQAVDQARLDSLTRSLTPSQILDVRYRLGLMYERGIGCVPDFVLADEWLLLGAAAGHARSRAESAALERRMSPEQISQAHSRSDNWLRRHAVKVASNAADR
jgi:type II secretory pathway predicted ATPase ExeA